MKKYFLNKHFLLLAVQKFSKLNPGLVLVRKSTTYHLVGMTVEFDVMKKEEAEKNLNQLTNQLNDLTRTVQHLIEAVGGLITQSELLENVVISQKLGDPIPMENLKVMHFDVPANKDLIEEDFKEIGDQIREVFEAKHAKIEDPEKQPEPEPDEEPQAEVVNVPKIQASSITPESKIPETAKPISGSVKRTPARKKPLTK